MLSVVVKVGVIQFDSNLSGVQKFPTRPLIQVLARSQYGFLLEIDTPVDPDLLPGLDISRLTSKESTLTRPGLLV